MTPPKLGLYLAAPWKFRDRMPALAQQAEDAGFAITHRWWEEDPELSTVYPQRITEGPTLKKLQEAALMDVTGVLMAHCLVVFQFDTLSEGKAVEQGLAMAVGTPVLIISEANTWSNIFQTLVNPAGFFPTFADCLTALQLRQREALHAFEEGRASVSALAKMSVPPVLH